MDGNDSMRAVVMTRYGSPDVLTVDSVPKPVPEEDEVLVRIHATVATPPDIAFRAAKPFVVRAFTGLWRPKHAIPGSSLAGVVEAVGAKVTRFAVGQRIHGATGIELGAYAEYRCLPEAGAIAAMPDETDFDAAVAMSEGYLTALPFLRDEAKLQPGQKILINGAAGSVGSSAVQLAHAMGAVVTGVCSGRNAELVRALGAARVIDYTQEDFTAEDGAYHVIFDAVGKSSFARCRATLKPGGVYMTTVPSLGILWQMLRTRRSSGKRALLATTGLRPDADKARDLEEMRQLVGTGKLRPVIDRRYLLEEIAAAHRHVESGHKRGSVVVMVRDRATT